MSFFGKWNALTLATLLVAAAGCSPDSSSPMDEEKEPHYELGKSRVNAFNYPGAIEAFEESLEANPHSAKAHFELAMLYENQVPDPAAAIYHYQQYLKYDTSAGNADVINGHITKCKQQLAENVLQLPSAPAVQQQLEKLTEENHRLHDQLAQWQAYYAAEQAAKTNPATPLNLPQPQSGPVSPVVPPPGSASNNGTGESTAAHKPIPAPPIKPKRTHTVAEGETMAIIAHKLGLNLPSLESANPGVNPKKLHVGQTLNLPEP